MSKRGHGSIINISSRAAGHGTPFLAAYGAAKAGLDVPTKTWALEYDPQGVRTNCVSPGAVRTPPADALGEMLDQMASATPLGRAAQPEEIAAIVTFLASEDASYLNGAIVPADAGMGVNYRQRPHARPRGRTTPDVRPRAPARLLARSAFSVSARSLSSLCGSAGSITVGTTRPPCRRRY